MDPDELPDLPVLTQPEEMLIARAHAFIEVRRIRASDTNITCIL
jgi:hypothetical protein